MSKRKPYNVDAGYVASRKCRDGGHSVVYDREKGGDWIDADYRWVVVKYPQTAIISVRTKKDALLLMKDVIEDGSDNQWWEDEDIYPIGQDEDHKQKPTGD